MGKAAPFPSYLEELSLDRAMLTLESHWETLPLTRMVVFALGEWEAIEAG